jgi:hypothetical protein
MTLGTDGAVEMPRDVVCYYHEPLKAPFLHHVVLPLVDRLRLRVPAIHVERHWLHGPHLRIRISGAPDAVAVAEREAVTALRAALLTHPSRAAIDHAELLRDAAIAGRAELVPGPYTPIHPDNTVRAEPPADGGIHRLLGTAAVRCRADLLRAGLHPLRAAVAELTENGNTVGGRLRIALTAMAVRAAHYPDGFALGYHTFLSHTEDFLYQHDHDGRIRAGFESRWQQRAAPLTAEVERLLAAAGTGTDPAVRPWVAWEEAAWSRCRAAHTRGELPIGPGEEYARLAHQLADPATIRRWDPTSGTTYSRYHLALQRLDFLNLPGVAEHFPPYRFATNVLYLLLSLADVTPMERYLAAYLFSQAVQRITGLTWQEGMRTQLTEIEEQA